MNAEERAELRAALENAWDAAEMTREEKRWLLNVADAAARYRESEAALMLAQCRAYDDMTRNQGWASQPVAAQVADTHTAMYEARAVLDALLKP